METADNTTATDLSADATELAGVSQKQAWRVSVSLEFDLLPVLTWRGEVQCGSPATAANRAIKAARKQFKGKKPRSWAICLEKV